MQELQLADVPLHVTERRRKKHRGLLLSAVTLKEEITSFRAVWNWGVQTGMLKGTFPGKGVVYPKTDEKPPFMTRAEVERRIMPGTADAARAELWDCLYLTKADSDELLATVTEKAAHPWVYPLFAFACHTGARRSEMIRVLVAGVDFEAGVFTVREKKRNRRQRTTRRVPMTPFQVGGLKEWLAEHPGGPFLFCHGSEVPRSKNRSRTTGHKGEAARGSSLKGRMKTVRARPTREPGPLTKDEVHDHFRRTLAGGRWGVVPGWHCSRHSFISLCASRGCDQRLIDEWTGHSTEEPRRRYRHLFPSTRKAAIESAFE